MKFERNVRACRQGEITNHDLIRKAQVFYLHKQMEKKKKILKRTAYENEIFTEPVQVIR